MLITRILVIITLITAIFSGLTPVSAQMDFSDVSSDSNISASNENLVNVELRDAGISFLVPSSFVENRKKDSSEQTVTFNGFDGRASVSINTGRLPENATLDTLEQVYSAKFLSGATLVSADRPRLGDGMALRKVYSLPLQETSVKLIIAITYAVRSGFFHVFKVTAQENLKWDQMAEVSSSLTTLENPPNPFQNNSMNRISSPARAASHQASPKNNTSTGSSISDPWSTSKPGIPMVINSFPEGAEVLLDGQKAGRTPLALNIDLPGVHRFDMFLEGYSPWSKELRIMGDAVAMIDAFLEPADNEQAENSAEKTLSDNPFTQTRTYDYSQRTGYSNQDTAADQEQNTVYRETDPGRRYYSYSENPDINGTFQPSQTADMTTVNDFTLYENKLPDLEKRVLWYETQLFSQRRKIDVSRKEERKIKELLQEISSAARELLSMQSGSSIASELLEKYSSLQKRARQIKNWTM
ncbi:MAG: hypothetical protein CVV64_08310 [Candidatus Wallbacteria bacterium HGW-Wallbacteria-1]|jgi:hypothetical protein|uniref:PEGA domain-containing protein n=1 Tax=Candidatus Wallbacteria bacterium HGW-Wallbacteria-1 TaxID=2013854 RepID=A0A2N1PRH0_9BACT|nr:MAG: hypothetical protein CVV64_08310 [Candidatus Wallbacteria bacterium HGW-Wallbacteria-1]